jgi:predicted nucleotidyltransferase
MINITIDKGLDFGEEFNSGLLKPQDELFPKFWKNNSLNAIVARKLMEIADEIIKGLDLGVDVEDVVITGSIASYNWHSLSDIDLHIMLDFEKIDDNFDLVKRMLDQIRINWNKKHNILIANKEVEIYFQHHTEPHEANGIWSLTLEKWLAAPVKSNPEIDIKTTEKKAEAIAQSIEHLFEIFKKENYEEARDYAGKIKSKIAKMRQSGLADAGIYSPENLAFKMLRNSGYLEKLSALNIEAYDRMMSLELEENNSVDFNKTWKDYLK